MYRKFKPLNIPDGWEQYWSKYPNGYTIMEALIDWVSQTNDLSNNVNEWNNYLKNFVEQFDDNLKGEVIGTLSEWQNTGFLEVVISEAIQWELDDYKTTNEADKVLINQQLTQTEDHLNATYINAKFPPKGNGIKADGVTDDYEALQYLLDNYKYIQLPAGSIKTSQTLKLRGNQHIKGAFSGTILTSDVVNLTIILGDNNVDETSSFSHSSIKDLYIDGFNKQGGQTGLQIRGYHSKIENVYIRKTDTPFKVGGVVVDFENMFIIDNGNSGLITSPSTNFNTMLTFKRCDFHTNNGALTDETPDNTVGLHFDYCVFENNSSRAFDLSPFSGSFNQCWFERNTERPLLKNYRVLMVKNRYETTTGYPSQAPEWREGTYAGAWETMGRVEIGSTDLSTRELKLQAYGPWGVPETETILKTVRSGGSRHLVHEVPDLNVSEYPQTVKTADKRKQVHVQINPNGEIVSNGFMNTTPVITKTRTGEYRINFGRTFDTGTIATVAVMGASSLGNANGPGDTFYHTVAYRSSASSAAYPRFNEMIVKVFKRTQPDETVDALSDGYINIVFYTNNY